MTATSKGELREAIRALGSIHRGLLTEVESSDLTSVVLGLKIRLGNLLVADYMNEDRE